jgi:hypothetical protein
MIKYLYYLAVIKAPDTLPNQGASSASGAKIQALLQVIFIILGSTALLMVTFGAFKYVISQGEPQTVESAKNTILYAVIGLVVALSAWALVTYVLNGVFK